MYVFLTDYSKERIIPDLLIIARWCVALANEQNLRPCEYKLSKEEAKRGGIRSGQVRRAKKTMAELAQLMLNSELDDKKKAEILFNSLGLNMTTAFNMFIKQAIMCQGLPFSVTLSNSSMI